ncbi:MAG: MBL fold metallo-hydrolase [SAR202 cluster bacterium]|nr:MBL fold metallo-hydrolase [SAR202 cluster bacterium]MDP6512377.1 MBL fold metallo-hydrolase [SAR202 cluster bacterium]MDP6714875.1 MBL fold metallo-hydrolase [SAR202 cluster bacterium]
MALLKPTEVTEGIFQLPAIASRVTALVSGDSVTLVDAGLKGSAKWIVRGLGRIGVSVEQLSTIAITHHHPDHSGGLSGLRKFTSAKIVAHRSDAAVVLGDKLAPNPYQNRLAALLASPVLPAFYGPTMPVDHQMDGGNNLPFMESVQVIHTPGHTPGSMSLYVRDKGVLIVGDALEYRRGKLKPPARMFTEDRNQAIESLRQLLELDFETICFSHFPALVKDAKNALRDMVEETAN